EYKKCALPICTYIRSSIKRDSAIPRTDNFFEAFIGEPLLSLVSRRDRDLVWDLAEPTHHDVPSPPCDARRCMPPVRGTSLFRTGMGDGRTRGHSLHRASSEGHERP